MNISHSDFDLFLASQILASNKDIFDDETEEHHRFTEDSEFKICRKCGGNMKNSFKLKRLIPKKPYSDWLRNIHSNRDLSMRNSDYFSENSGTHLDPHIPEQDSQNSDQPNSSSKLLVSESIRLQNSTFSQNECYFSTGENQDDSETSLILKVHIKKFYDSLRVTCSYRGVAQFLGIRKCLKIFHFPQKGLTTLMRKPFCNKCHCVFFISITKAC